MPQRLAFFHCIQKSFESVTDFEMRIRSIASKSKFEEITNPYQEVMRDRLCPGVHNKDLRKILLHHYKPDVTTPLSFDVQLTKVKCWKQPTTPT